MWDLAVREEDYDAADSLLPRFPAPPPLSMRVLSALARGDSATRARILDELRTADNRQPQIAARFVATYLEDFTTAEQLARLNLAPQRRPALRAGVQEFLAWLELARGRWSGARREFATSERLEGEAASVRTSRALAATLPFLAVPRVDLEAVRDEIEQWEPGSEAPGANPSFATALRAHLRLYLLGLLNSRLGDGARALRLARELERLGAPSEARAAVRGLAQTVRADVAWRAGRSAEALAALEPVQGEVPMELVNVPLYSNLREYSQEHARYLRAELLYLLGRDPEALRWLETSFQGAPSELAYLAPLHLRRGEIYERMGEREKAAEHYSRFIKLWKDCDPELRPLVQEAEARLAGLAGEPQ